MKKVRLKDETLVLLDLVGDALDLKVEKSIDSSGVTGAASPRSTPPFLRRQLKHLMSQAKKVKDALVLWSSRSALFPNWPKKF